MSDYDWIKSKSEYPFFCIECMEPVEKDVCDTCGCEVNNRHLICECEDFSSLRAWLGESEEIKHLKSDDMARVKDMSLLLNRIAKLKDALEGYISKFGDCGDCYTQAVAAIPKEEP